MCAIALALSRCPRSRSRAERDAGRCSSHRSRHGPGGPEIGPGTDQTSRRHEGHASGAEQQAGEVVVRSWDRDVVRIAGDAQRARNDRRRRPPTNAAHPQPRGARARRPRRLSDHGAALDAGQPLGHAISRRRSKARTAEVTVETVHGNVRVVGGIGRDLAAIGRWAPSPWTRPAAASRRPRSTKASASPTHRRHHRRDDQRRHLHRQRADVEPRGLHGQRRRHLQRHDSRQRRLSSSTRTTATSASALAAPPTRRSSCARSRATSRPTSRSSCPRARTRAAAASASTSRSAPAARASSCSRSAATSISPGARCRRRPKNANSAGADAVQESHAGAPGAAGSSAPAPKPAPKPPPPPPGAPEWLSRKSPTCRSWRWRWPTCRSWDDAHMLDLVADADSRIGEPFRCRQCPRCCRCHRCRPCLGFRRAA